VKTVTLKLQDAVLPEGSVAVQVTVVVPTGKGEPDGGLQTTVAEQLSEAVGGGKLTTVLVASGQVCAATAVTAAGQVIVGASVSLTVTVKEHIGPATGASRVISSSTQPIVPVSPATLSTTSSNQSPSLGDPLCIVSADCGLNVPANGAPPVVIEVGAASSKMVLVPEQSLRPEP